MTDPLILGAFTTMANELLEDHLTEDNQPEGALLHMLYESIGSSSGAGSAPGGSERAKAPLDLGALQLWDSIARVIRQYDPTRQAFSEADMLRSWIKEASGFVQAQLELMEHMAEWIQLIRAHFNPPKLIPLRGATCPLCKQAKDAEGQEPLVLHASVVPPFAECGNCGNRWTAGELLDLRAQLH